GASMRTSRPSIGHPCRRVARGMLALAILAIAHPHDSGAVFPGSNGRIAFYYRFNDGLYTVNPDGSGFQVIRSDLGRWLGPRWSKDGTRLDVGVPHTKYGQGIWAGDADGGNEER